MSEKIGVDEARRLIAGGEAKAIDCRDDEDWREGRVSGAVHLDAEDVDTALAEVSDEVQLIVIGPEETATRLAEQLRERGREAAYLEGGLEAWKEEDYKIQPSQDVEPGSKM